MNPEQIRLNAQIEDRHWWFAARRRIVGELVREVEPPSKDALVIDVGCGTGGNSGHFAHDYSVVGIDTSPEAVRLSRQRFPAVQFIHGSAPDALGELVERARVFLMMDVLEHVRDDFEIFSAVLARARVGSHFLLTVPAYPDLWSQHDEASLHWRRYEPWRLERVWQGLPVTPRLVSHYNARLYPLVRIVRELNKKLGRSSGEASTDMWIPNALTNRTLEGIFAGEAKQLARALRERRGTVYGAGVSMVAVLRREPGDVIVRKRPTDLPPDPNAPRWPLAAA